MCILTPNDDLLPATLAQKFIGASTRLEQAQARVLRLAIRLDDGDVAANLGESPDYLIRRTIGEMFSARFEYDNALCSLMKGEEYRPLPTQAAIGVEMQARMHRNGRPHLPSSALPATVSPCAAE